eukprot:4661339-Alexandrium_andersonii.AAC.1
MGGRRESAAPSYPRPQESHRRPDQREEPPPRAGGAPWCAGAQGSTAAEGCGSAHTQLCLPCGARATRSWPGSCCRGEPSTRRL